MALDTESYESYLAPRVAAVQSERRPGQGGALSSAVVAQATLQPAPMKVLSRRLPYLGLCR